MVKRILLNFVENGYYDYLEMFTGGLKLFSEKPIEEVKLVQDEGKPSDIALFRTRYQGWSKVPHYPRKTSYQLLVMWIPCAFNLLVT